MNKEGWILIVFLISWPLHGIGQQMLTLKECYERACSSSVLTLEKQAYTEIWQLKDKNLITNRFPDAEAGGSIIYNSSVVDMTDVFGSLPLNGITDFIRPMPHEQYRVTLDITQTVYDGGITKNTRAMERADLEISRKLNDAELYQIRGQINNFYFQLLLLDRQKELLYTYLELVNKKLISVKSAVTGGVKLKSDLDVLTSGKIKLEQQISENHIRISSFREILADLTGIRIDNSTELVLPSPVTEYPVELARPELQVFDLRKDHLNTVSQTIQSKRMPQAFVFATLGFGNPPGSNFFKDEFEPYYVLGAGVQWSIYDWNRVSNEKKILYLRQSVIENRKNDMKDNLRRLLDAKYAEIKSLELLVETDVELIEIRKRITLTAESSYENGTITATDYMNELSSEKQALINHEIHKINLAMARVEFLNISGKEIE